MTDQHDIENLDQAYESEIREPTNKYPELEDSWITRMQRYQPPVNLQPKSPEESNEQDKSPEYPQQNDQYYDLLNFSGQNLPNEKADVDNQEISPDLPDEKPLVRGQSLEEFTDIDFGPRRIIEPKLEEKPASQKVENQTFKELKLQNLNQPELINSITTPPSHQAELSQKSEKRMTSSNLFPESLDSQQPVYVEKPKEPKIEQRMNKWGIPKRAESNLDNQDPEETLVKKPESQPFKEMNLKELDQLEMVDSVMVPQSRLSQPDKLTASNLFGKDESLDEPDDHPKVEERITKWGVARQNSGPQTRWGLEPANSKAVGISQLSFGTDLGMGRESDKSSTEKKSHFESQPQPHKEEIKAWDEKLEDLDDDVDENKEEQQEEVHQQVNYGMRVKQQELEEVQVQVHENKYEPEKEEEKEEEENIEVVEEEEEEVKKVEMFQATEEVFADENMLYPMMNSIRQNLLKISQTMGTQTNDQELIKRCQTISSSNYDISIPEEKVIKDGYLYTYILYKIVTKIYEDEKKEYAVHRRYNDFKLLFEVLEKKYKGYVIPLLPPKNLLTTINKESSEFAETRKKELIDFLKKCMQHPFIQTTEEMFIFLTDDKGFHNFIKKEQQADAHHKNFDIWTIWDKVSQVAAKVTSRKPVHREMTPLDNELYNHESSLVGLQGRLENVYKFMIQYLDLKRKNINNLIFFTKNLKNLAGKKRGNTVEDLKKSLKNSTISSVEDKLIRDLRDLAENQLKGIIKTVEAMIYSLQKRNTVIQELHELQTLIEEQDLNVKKNMATQEQLDDLRKQYEVLKEKFQKLSETLLSEVEYFRENITTELARFVQTVYENNEKSLNEALQLWLIETQSI